MPSDDVVLDRVATALAAHPAASMDDLARAAGIGRATLFRRFARREDLVAGLCRRAVDLFVAATEFLGEPAGQGTGAGGSRGQQQAGHDLREVVRRLAPLGAQYGVLSTQPLEQLVEAEVLARAAEGEERLRELVRRGQREGAFRIEVDPEWFLTVLLWSLVGAADGVRLGRLAPARTIAAVTDTLERLLRL